MIDSVSQFSRLGFVSSPEKPPSFGAVVHTGESAILHHANEFGESAGDITG